MSDMKDGNVARTDLRCDRKNGDWHCSVQRLNGRKYCDKHSQFEPRDKAKFFSENSSQEAEEEDKAEGLKKAETRASVEAVEREEDEMRCVYRCWNPRLGQQILCEVHCKSGRRTKGDESRVRVSEDEISSSWEEENEEVKLDIIPEDELRCKRNDGKNWRCKNWRIQDQNFCQEHYLVSSSKCRVSASKKRERKKGKPNQKENMRKNKGSSMKRNRQESCSDGEEEEVSEEGKAEEEEAPGCPNGSVG
ncbi:uncharacterized protein LOC122665822 [Telopea speciosissima]|uniref:uncharacterized protein LOC122665822 n=1 Tax=Telopea speciosissima TaxID=54955 RepID=UPI001CC79AA4|nr:uncharacterized protein LOC122665822 [Telopea speciosissima]